MGATSPLPRRPVALLSSITRLIFIPLVLCLLFAPRGADAINNGAFITAPTSLAGPLRFEPAMLGPMPPAANLTAEVVISVVDPCIWNVSADASVNYTLPASVSGKIVLFQATGALTCSFGFLVAQMQARGAAGVVFPIKASSTLETYIVESTPIALYVRDPPFPVASFQIPVMSIGAADSAAIKAAIINGTIVTIHWLGSGPAQPAQKAALASLYQTMTSNGNAPWTFGGYKTGVDTDLSGDLQPWDLLLTNASYDPCVNRAYGIWCIGGNIVMLHCPNCGIRGAIPAAIGQLVHVQEIFLASNAISGALPCDVGQLTKLRVVSLEKNQISSLSACFGQLTQMEFLAVGQNTYLAALPPQLSSFTSLALLTAGDNSLTSVPDLSLLTALTVIDLSNNQIAQPIMPSFAAFTQLQSLDLHGNLYTGSLSASAFDSLLYLTSVNLGFNKLDGPLPDFSVNGATSRITSIYLAYNKFSGTVPLGWRFLQKLVSCSLAHNAIISPVQPFVVISSLKTLDLSFNNLTLLAIDSGGRQLTGNLGPFLRFSVPNTIDTVLLNNNLFSGVFSTGWAAFSKISVISVANNKLSGVLPIDLWTEFNAAKTIQRFDLSGNLWIAPLPPGAPPNCLREISLTNCPLLANALTDIPSFLQASNEFILDASTKFSCPRLISNDILGFYKFFVDPVCF